MSSPWSELGQNLDSFLRDPDDPLIGAWAVGQGVDAPDRAHFRDIISGHAPCSILEVGCGSGIELEGLLRDGLDVDYLGVDLTPELVAVCQQRFPDHHFACVDLFDLTDTDAFDIVHARAVLEHVDDVDRALRILYRACRDALIISWFLPPVRDRAQIRKIRSDDGFLHQTYHRDRLLRTIRTCHPVEFIETDYEHAGIRSQVWEVWKRR